MSDREDREEIGDIVETGKGRDTGVFSVEWTIPGFLSLPGKDGGSHESPIFYVCDAVWCFSIYPNEEGWIGLFLCRVVGDSPETLHIRVGVKGVEGVENRAERRHEFSKCDYTTCRWHRFIYRSELMKQKSRWMPGKALTISCDMKRVPRSVTKGMEELLKSLHGLLAGGEDSDVLIKVQGKEFPAHRAILRARSPVFQAMFSHDMVEKQRGVVTVEDCDPETFSDFLEHVYTSSVEMISVNNVFSLFSISDKYDLKALKAECAEFMKQNLTVASFCNTITLSMKYGDAGLIERATAFFCRNSIKIVETAEWQTFLQENPTVGNELFIKSLRRNRNVSLSTS